MTSIMVLVSVVLVSVNNLKFKHFLFGAVNLATWKMYEIFREQTSHFSITRIAPFTLKCQIFGKNGSLPIPATINFVSHSLGLMWLGVAYSKLYTDTYTMTTLGCSFVSKKGSEC